MDTSVTLEPDAFHLTAAYAAAKGLTVSAAGSELIRRAEDLVNFDGASAEEHRVRTGRLVEDPLGFLVIAGTGRRITSEMVKEFSEDEIV